MRYETNTVLAQKIMLLRGKAGESQQSLADSIGVKRETIKFWESGGRQIKGGDIVKLAEHFNVSADYLLGLSDVATTDTELHAVCKYTGLSETSIKKIKHIMNVPLRRGLDFSGTITYSDILNRLIESQRYEIFIEALGTVVASLENAGGRDIQISSVVDSLTSLIDITSLCDIFEEQRRKLRYSVLDFGEISKEIATEMCFEVNKRVFSVKDVECSLEDALHVLREKESALLSYNMDIEHSGNKQTQL